jgi:DNA-binding CsgD family transcriptional regulator
MRHKRIIDIAAEKPNASYTEIADEIPSATADLVENVLEEYGDPADDAKDDLGKSQENPDPEGDSESHENSEPHENSKPDENSESHPDTVVSNPTQVSKKELETLRTIHKNPELTQSEIGNILNVSNATVCYRVNRIEGFEWENRQEFTTSFFDMETKDQHVHPEIMDLNGTEKIATIDDLVDRVSHLEEQIREQNCQKMDASKLGEAELHYKIIHACIQSNIFTEEEELEIMKMILSS